MYQSKKQKKLLSHTQFKPINSSVFMKRIIIKRGDDNKNREKNIKIELFIQRQKQIIILLLSTIHYTVHIRKRRI